MPKHFLNNFEKVQKKTIAPPINGQNKDANLAKSVDFWVHFRSTGSIFALLIQKKNRKNRFP